MRHLSLHEGIESGSALNLTLLADFQAGAAVFFQESGLFFTPVGLPLGEVAATGT
jgi:hypothetical protein